MHNYDDIFVRRESKHNRARRNILIDDRVYDRKHPILGVLCIVVAVVAFGIGCYAVLSLWIG